MKLSNNSDLTLENSSSDNTAISNISQPTVKKENIDEKLSGGKSNSSSNGSDFAEELENELIEQSDSKDVLSQEAQEISDTNQNIVHEQSHKSFSTQPIISQTANPMIMNHNCPKQSSEHTFIPDNPDFLYSQQHATIQRASKENEHIDNPQEQSLMDQNISISQYISTEPVNPVHNSHEEYFSGQFNFKNNNRSDNLSLRDNRSGFNKDTVENSIHNHTRPSNPIHKNNNLEHSSQKNEENYIDGNKKFYRSTEGPMTISNPYPNISSFSPQRENIPFHNPQGQNISSFNPQQQNLEISDLNQKAQKISRHHPFNPNTTDLSQTDHQFLAQQPFHENINHLQGFTPQQKDFKTCLNSKEGNQSSVKVGNHNSLKKGLAQHTDIDHSQRTSSITTAISQQHINYSNESNQNFKVTDKFHPKISEEFPGGDEYAHGRSSKTNKNHKKDSNQDTIQDNSIKNGDTGKKRDSTNKSKNGDTGKNGDSINKSKSDEKDTSTQKNNMRSDIKQETVKKIIKLRTWLRSDSSLECIYRSLQFTTYFLGFAEGILKELPYGSIIIDDKEHKNNIYPPLQDRSLIYRLLYRLKYSNPPPLSLITVLYLDLLFDPLFYNKCLIIKTLVIYIRKWKESVDERVYEGINTILYQIHSGCNNKEPFGENRPEVIENKTKNNTSAENGFLNSPIRDNKSCILPNHLRTNTDKETVGDFQKDDEKIQNKKNTIFNDDPVKETGSELQNDLDSDINDKNIIKNFQNNRMICSLLNEIVTFMGFSIKLHKESFFTMNILTDLLIIKRDSFNNREWYSVMAKCVKLICENRGLKQYISESVINFNMIPSNSEIQDRRDLFNQNDSFIPKEKNKLSTLFQLIVSQLNISPFQYELDKEILQNFLVLAKQDKEIVLPYIEQIFEKYLRSEELVLFDNLDLENVDKNLENIVPLAPVLLYILVDLAILYSKTSVIVHIYQKVVQMLIINNLNDVWAVYRGHRTFCQQQRVNILQIKPSKQNTSLKNHEENFDQENSRKPCHYPSDNPSVPCRNENLHQRHIFIEAEKDLTYRNALYHSKEHDNIIFAWSLPNLRYILDILVKCSDLRIDCRNNFFISMYLINRTLWDYSDSKTDRNKTVFDPEYMTIENRSKILSHILRRCLDLVKFTVSKNKGILTPFEKQCLDRMVGDLLLYHAHGNKNVNRKVLRESCFQSYEKFISYEKMNKKKESCQNQEFDEENVQNNPHEYTEHEKFVPHGNLQLNQCAAGKEKRNNLYQKNVNSVAQNRNDEYFPDSTNISKDSYENYHCSSNSNGRFGTLVDGILKEIFHFIVHLPNSLDFYRSHINLLLYQNQNITFMISTNNLIVFHEILCYLLEQTVKNITEYGKCKYLKKCYCCMTKGTPYDTFYKKLLKSSQVLFQSLQQSKQATPQPNVIQDLFHSLNQKFINFAFLFLSRKIYHLITWTFQTLSLDIPPTFLEKLFKADTTTMNNNLFYLETILTLPVTINPLLTWIREYLQCMENILQIKYIGHFSYDVAERNSSEESFSTGQDTFQTDTKPKSLNNSKNSQSNSKENSSRIPNSSKNNNSTNQIHLKGNDIHLKGNGPVDRPISTIQTCLSTQDAQEETQDWLMTETKHFTLPHLINLKSLALSHTENFLENLRTEFLREIVGELNIIRMIKEVLQFIIETEHCLNNLSTKKHNQEINQEIFAQLNKLRVQTAKILAGLKDEQRKEIEKKHWEHSRDALHHKEQRIMIISNHDHLMDPDFLWGQDPFYENILNKTSLDKEDRYKNSKQFPLNQQNLNKNSSEKDFAPDSNINLFLQDFTENHLRHCLTLLTGRYYRPTPHFIPFRPTVRVIIHSDRKRAFSEILKFLEEKKYEAEQMEYDCVMGLILYLCGLMNDCESFFTEVQMIEILEMEDILSEKNNSLQFEGTGTKSNNLRIDRHKLNVSHKQNVSSKPGHNQPYPYLFFKQFLFYLRNTTCSTPFLALKDSSDHILSLHILRMFVESSSIDTNIFIRGKNFCYTETGAYISSDRLNQRQNMNSNEISQQLNSNKLNSQNCFLETDSITSNQPCQKVLEEKVLIKKVIEEKVLEEKVLIKKVIEEKVLMEKVLLEDLLNTYLNYTGSCRKCIRNCGTRGLHFFLKTVLKQKENSRRNNDENSSLSNQKTKIVNNFIENNIHDILRTMFLLVDDHFLDVSDSVTNLLYKILVIYHKNIKSLGQYDNLSHTQGLGHVNQNIPDNDLQKKTEGSNDHYETSRNSLHQGNSSHQKNNILIHKLEDALIKTLIEYLSHSNVLLCKIAQNLLDYFAEITERNIMDILMERKIEILSPFYKKKRTTASMDIQTKNFKSSTIDLSSLPSYHSCVSYLLQFRPFILSFDHRLINFINFTVHKKNENMEMAERFISKVVLLLLEDGALSQGVSTQNDSNVQPERDHKIDQSQISSIQLRQAQTIQSDIPPSQNEKVQISLRIMIFFILYSTNTLGRVLLNNNLSVNLLKQAIIFCFDRNLFKIQLMANLIKILDEKKLLNILDHNITDVTKLNLNSINDHGIAQNNLLTKIINFISLQSVNTVEEKEDFLTSISILIRMFNEKQQSGSHVKTDYNNSSYNTENFKEHRNNSPLLEGKAFSGENIDIQILRINLNILENLLHKFCELLYDTIHIDCIFSHSDTDNFTDNLPDITIFVIKTMFFTNKSDNIFIDQNTLVGKIIKILIEKAHLSYPILLYILRRMYLNDQEMAHKFKLLLENSLSDDHKWLFFIAASPLIYNKIINQPKSIKKINLILYDLDSNNPFDVIRLKWMGDLRSKKSRLPNSDECATLDSNKNRSEKSRLPNSDECATLDSNKNRSERNTLTPEKKAPFISTAQKREIVNLQKNKFDSSEYKYIMTCYLNEYFDDDLFKICRKIYQQIMMRPEEENKPSFRQGKIKRPEVSESSIESFDQTGNLDNLNLLKTPTVENITGSDHHLYGTDKNSNDLIKFIRMDDLILLSVAYYGLFHPILELLPFFLSYSPVEYNRYLFKVLYRIIKENTSSKNHKKNNDYVNQFLLGILQQETLYRQQIYLLYPLILSLSNENTQTVYPVNSSHPNDNLGSVKNYRSKEPTISNENIKTSISNRNPEESSHTNNISNSGLFHINTGILLELSDSVVRLLSTASLIHHRVALGIFKVIYDSIENWEENELVQPPTLPITQEKVSNFSIQCIRSIYTLLFSLTIHQPINHNILLFGIFYFKNCRIKHSFLNLNEVNLGTTIICIGLEIYKEKISRSTSSKLQSEQPHKKQQVIKDDHSNQSDNKNDISTHKQTSSTNSNMQISSSLLPKLISFLQQNGPQVFIDQYSEFDLRDYMFDQYENLTYIKNKIWKNNMSWSDHNIDTGENLYNPMALIMSLTGTNFLISLLETLSSDLKQLKTIQLLIREISFRLISKQYFNTDTDISELFEQFTRIATPILPYTDKMTCEIVLNVLSEQSSIDLSTIGTSSNDSQSLNDPSKENGSTVDYSSPILIGQKKNKILLTHLLLAQSLPKHNYISILSGIRSVNLNIRAISYQVLYKLIENEMDVDFNMNQLICQAVYKPNTNITYSSTSMKLQKNCKYNASSLKIPQSVINLINTLTPLEHLRLFCLDNSFFWFNSDITEQILQSCSESLSISYLVYQRCIGQARMNHFGIFLRQSSVLTPLEGTGSSEHPDPNTSFNQFSVQNQEIQYNQEISIEDFLELTTTQPFLSFLPFIPCNIDFDSFLSTLSATVRNRTIKKAIFHMQIDEYVDAQKILNQVIKQIAQTNNEPVQKGGKKSPAVPEINYKTDKLQKYHGSYTDADINILEYLWLFCAKQLHQYDSIGEIGIRINDLDKIMFGQFHGQVTVEEKNNLRALIQAKYLDSSGEQNDICFNRSQRTSELGSGRNNYSSDSNRLDWYNRNNTYQNSIDGILNLNKMDSIVKMPFYSLIKQFVSFDPSLFERSICYLSAYLLSCDKTEAITMMQAMYENYQFQNENVQIENLSKMVTIYPHWSEDLTSHYTLLSLRRHLLTDSSSLKSFHNIAKGYNHLGLLNYHNNFLDIAQYHLTKIFSLSNIEIIDAFHKIHTDLLVYEKRNQNSLGIEFVNIANLNFFTDNHKSRLFSLKGQLSKNEIYLKQGCQLANVPENWYAWGEFLKEKMYQGDFPSKSADSSDSIGKISHSKDESKLNTSKEIVRPGSKEASSKEILSQSYNLKESKDKESYISASENTYDSNNSYMTQPNSHNRNVTDTENTIEKSCFSAFLYTLNTKVACENENIRKHSVLVLLRLFYNRNYPILQSLINEIEISYFHFYIPLLLEQLQTKEYLCAELILKRLTETHAQIVYMECLRFENSLKKRFSLIEHDFGPGFSEHSFLQEICNSNNGSRSNNSQNQDRGVKTSGISPHNTNEFSIGSNYIGLKGSNQKNNLNLNGSSPKSNDLDPYSSAISDFSDSFDTKNKKFDKSPLNNMRSSIFQFHYQMIHSMEQLSLVLERLGQLSHCSLFICIIDKALRLAMEIYFCLYRKDEYICKSSEVERRLSYFDKDRNTYKDDLSNMNLFGAFDEASLLQGKKNFSRKKFTKKSSITQKKDLNLLFATLKSQIERISTYIGEPQFRADFYDKELSISEVIKLLYKWKHLFLSRENKQKQSKKSPVGERDTLLKDKYELDSNKNESNQDLTNNSDASVSYSGMKHKNMANHENDLRPGTYNTQSKTTIHNTPITSSKDTNSHDQPKETSTNANSVFKIEKGETVQIPPFYFKQKSNQGYSSDRLYDPDRSFALDKKTVGTFEKITLDELLFLNLHLSQFNVPCIGGLRPEKPKSVGIAGFNKGKNNEIQLMGIDGKLYNFTFLYNIHTQTSDYNLMMSNMIGYFVDNEKEASRLQRRSAKLHPFKHLYISNNIRLQYNDDTFLKISNISNVNIDQQKIQYIDKMKKYETGIHEVILKGVFANTKKSSLHTISEENYETAQKQFDTATKQKKITLKQKDSTSGQHDVTVTKQESFYNEDNSHGFTTQRNINHRDGSNLKDQIHTRNLNVYQSGNMNSDTTLDGFNIPENALGIKGERGLSPENISKRIKLQGLRIRMTILHAPYEKKQSVFQYMLNSVSSNHLTQFLWSVHRNPKEHQQYRYSLIGHMAMTNFFRYFFYIKIKKPCDVQIGLDRGIIYNISYSRCTTYHLSEENTSQEIVNIKTDSNIVRRITLRLSPNIVKYFDGALSGRFLSLGHLFRNYLIHSNKTKDLVRLFTSMKISKVYARLEKDPSKIINENMDITIRTLIDPAAALWF